MHLLFLLLAVVGLARAESGFDPENCMSCHGQPWFAVADSMGVHSFYIDEDHYRNSAHGRFACRQCHQDIDRVPHRIPVQPVNCTVACHLIDPYTGEDYSHRKWGEELAASVHGQRPGARHNDLKPVCKDCHFNSSYWQDVPANLRDARDKCLACHENEDALDRDFKHLALHMSENQYWRHEQNFLACVRCHTNNDLVSDSVAALLLDNTMVTSFMKSFHGRGFAFGDNRSPVCADCHGTHAIFSHRDERSMIHPANLVQTCGTTGCHDGATYAFATAGSMHNLYEGSKALVLHWITRIYIVLIVGVLGGMILHNLLDLVAWRRRRKAALAAGLRPPAEGEKAERPRRFRRMNKAERVSHVVMFVSFTLLALTGALLWVPVHYFGTLTEWEYFMPVRDWSHRVAAIMITLVAVYHVGYAFFTKRGRALLREMLPGPQDVRHIFQNISHLLGKRPHPPAFRFFNYSEKMEYWAFVWGSLVMTATGVILWFKQYGSKFIVDVARLVHSLEAILAVSAIVVWHFWNVHWKPGRWPMSETWINGAIDEEDLKEEHGAMLDPELSKTFYPELLEEEKRVGPDRRKRVLAVRAIGWSFLVLTVLTCGVMIWSFQLYLSGPSGETQNLNLVQGLARPLADQAALEADPSYALRVAHEDTDWRHERFHSATPVIVEDPAARRSECLLCHSWLPHQEDIKTRAYLNLHSRFMTCETCHAGEGAVMAGEFRWLDLRSDPQGSPGTPFHVSTAPAARGESNYYSRIGLIKDGDPVFADIDSPRAREYQANPATMTQARINEVKKTFHDRIDDSEGAALGCRACHTESGGMMDFRRLGFDEQRTLELRSVARTASVTDYEIFYLPAPY
jgi:cytochrome b subunit of formate dehydrogenase